MNSHKPQKSFDNYDNYWEKIKESIGSSNVNDLIDLAKEIAKTDGIKKIETSQMRNFLDGITKIKQTTVDIEIKDEPINKIIKSKLALLRPKFAYTVSRKGNQALKDLNSKLIDKWLQDSSGKFLTTTKHLEYFHLFIESLVAWHKVYAKK